MTLLGQTVAVTGPRSAVVVNPAKVTDLVQLRNTLRSTLAKAGWPDPEWYETTPEDTGRGQARKAVAEGAELVFACGGDGTVTAVVTALTGTGVALAVLPAGTGNLLAANLGLGTDPLAGLQVAIEGGRRRIDVGVIGDQCFVVMAGMGFDAMMLQDTSERAKRRIGWPAYLFGAAKHLLDRPMRVRIRLDGGSPMPRRAQTVIVGNVGRLQGGVRLLKRAVPDDGKLNVAIVSPNNLFHWALVIAGVASRRERVPRMETFTASRVEIYSNHAQPRQLDGDLIASGKAMKISVRHKALILCVPQPDADPDLAHDAKAVAKRARAQ